MSINRFLKNTRTPSGGDDLEGIKRRAPNNSTSPISMQKGSGHFKSHLL